MAARIPPDIRGMHSLKVDNLTYRTNVDDLKRAFDKYGEIGDVYIPRDNYTQESRGFAFVRFFDERDAEDAIDEMDGKTIDGREVRCAIAKYSRPDNARQRHPGGGGGGYRGGRYGGGGYGGGGGGGYGGGGGGGGYGRGGGGGGYRSRRYSRSRSRSRDRRRSRSRSRDRKRYTRSRSDSRSPVRKTNRSLSPRRSNRSASPRKSRSPNAVGSPRRSAPRQSRSRSRSRSMS